ncbi:fatty acid binding protein 1-A, liver [Hyalella azteca]|uniref:Fatty acid binding protein 1-A, liver n=1 Tax=Hyalella azteca TaxID=294128 RepID=A0A8B7P8D6_HYAAZ|nr:fatty acid binding protein 1-A, liver [Hyalella azteca]
MAMTGKFVLSASDNYEAFLKAGGACDEAIKKASAAKPTLDIVESATGVTITTSAGDQSATNVITYGQDSPAELAGRKFTVNVSKTSSGYSGTLTLEGKTGQISADIDGSTLTRTMTYDGVTTKRTFTKQ